MAEVKEWVRISHGLNYTSVTVSLVRGSRSSRWTSKTNGSVEAGLREARTGAYRNLDEVEAVLDRIGNRP